MGGELILGLTVVKGWQKNDVLGLCPYLYCLQGFKEDTN